MIRPALSLPSIFMPNGTQAAVSDELSPATGQDRSSIESEETVLAAWRVHPLRDNPRGIAPVAIGYALAFALWRLLFPHPLGLFLPIVALTGALSEYLFPTSYRLTTRGAHADSAGLSRLFIAWGDVRRATRGADGVHLSPFSRPSGLDRFRGVRLKFTGDTQAEDAIRVIQEQRQIHARPEKTGVAVATGTIAVPAAEGTP